VKRFGARSRLIDLVEREEPSKLEPYSEGEEKVKVSVGSEGGASIVHAGDGDPTLETRIYVDGELRESCSCNEATLFHARFGSRLEVKVYSGVDQEARSSGVYVTCVSRR